MEFFHKNQKAILIIVLLLAAFYAYNTFFKSDVVPVAQDAEAERVGSEVLELNSRLQAVKLDQSLFSYSLYRKLIDFVVTIPNQPIGRPNPFNELGRD